MITDAFGNCSFSTQEVIELIYNGESVDQLTLDNEIESSLHKEHAKHFDIKNLVPSMKIDIPADEYHQLLSNTWIIPDEYANMDIELYLTKQLTNLKLNQDVYIDRLADELDEYKQRNMMQILIYLVYMMDVCKQNNIVTGIGRGSSVSSLILYLIGTHHIDPIKYNLSYKEFLR
jgi:DNA polymerase-3 subunit alpha